MEELPPGWTEVSFSEVFECFQYGLTAKAVPDATGTRLLRITDIRGEDINWETVPGLSVQNQDIARFRLRSGDFVFARSGSVEKVARIDNPPEAVFASYLIRARPRHPAFSDWLMWFTRSGDYLSQIADAAAGIGMANINAEKLARFRLPFPPLAEQRRIVARIEALFARTRRARAELGRTQALATHLIERSRASIFSNVTDSKEIGGQKFADLPPYTPPARFEGLPDLPHGWRWVQMDAIAHVTGGLTKNQGRNSFGIQMPYLRVANVYADELRLEEIATIGVTDAERERVSLRAGDLLVVEGNGSLDQIGRVAIWDGSVEGCGHQNHLIRVRPLNGVPSRWLLHWLMSPYGRAVLEAAASSSSGLHTLSLSKIASLPVPLPSSPDEARAVVDTVDAALMRGHRTEAEATRALALLDRLDAAILARAFRGELVPQDPADEPARLPSLPTAPRTRRARAAQLPAALP